MDGPLRRGDIFRGGDIAALGTAAAAAGDSGSGPVGIGPSFPVTRPFASMTTGRKPIHRRCCMIRNCSDELFKVFDVWVDQFISLLLHVRAH